MKKSFRNFGNPNEDPYETLYTAGCYPVVSLLLV